MRKVSRKPTNLSLNSAVLEEAKKYQINLSQAAEEGLKTAIAKARSEEWKLANKSGIESSNAWVEEHGLPLDSHRFF